MSEQIPSNTAEIGQNLYFESEGTSHIDFQNIKAASDTIKKNPKLEFSQTELLKLLSYLEGELQARDVVIATLKSENIKQLLQAVRHKPLGLNDPNAALFRDGLALTGNFVSRQSSSAAAQCEQGMRTYARQQLETLENTILQQRLTHLKLINIIKEAEAKHTHLMNELEEEKQKHERDTAQGDDITYGLEVERTRLKQDLEAEKQTCKKLEKDLKKLQETLDSERARQKPIVLLLLAERKRIIMKYIEERKRSEDLAQILSEEKQRVDTIAEGLEEESKKSLRMEAELEKQTQLFDAERKLLKASLATEEKRVKDQEADIAHLKSENELLRKQPRLPGHGPINVGVPQIPSKSGLNSRAISDPLDDNSSASPMMSSVAKVVQPTATVSSVPVSGPTTGIARSISPGQSLRQTSTDVSTFNSKVTPRKLSNASSAAPPIVTAPLVMNNTLGKSASISTSNTPATATVSQHATIKKNPASNPISRGVPPPIPPNKPIVPPKREPSATRLLANNSNSNNSSTTNNNSTNNTITTAGSIANNLKDNKEPNNSSILSDDSTCLPTDMQDYQQAISSIANK